MTIVPSIQRRGVSLLPTSIRSKPGLAVAIAFLVLIVVVAASASFLPYDAYRQDLLHRNSPPVGTTYSGPTSWDVTCWLVLRSEPVSHW